MDNFKIINPNPILSEYVSHYWILKSEDESLVGERVVPTGTVSLVFHRGDRLESDRKGVQPQSFVSGITTDYDDLGVLGRLDMFVVVFRPAVAHIFFSIPLDKFSGSSIAVEDIGDLHLTDISDRILSAGTDDEAVLIIEDFLISRLRIADDYMIRRLQQAVALINNDQVLRVAHLADSVCLSERQFNRLFSSNIGANPKDFMRIVRFQRALYAFQTNSQMNFAQVAAACGYFDQAHMIRDFRQFSGYTPSEFITLCDPYSDYFTSE